MTGLLVRSPYLSILPLASSRHLVVYHSLFANPPHSYPPTLKTVALPSSPEPMRHPRLKSKCDSASDIPELRDRRRLAADRCELCRSFALLLQKE